jgi:hypothetical protein
VFHRTSVLATFKECFTELQYWQYLSPQVSKNIYDTEGENAIAIVLQQEVASPAWRLIFSTHAINC